MIYLKGHIYIQNGISKMNWQQSCINGRTLSLLAKCLIIFKEKSQATFTLDCICILFFALGVSLFCILYFKCDTVALYSLELYWMGTGNVQICIINLRSAVRSAVMLGISQRVRQSFVYRTALKEQRTVQSDGLLMLIV